MSWFFWSGVLFTLLLVIWLLYRIRRRLFRTTLGEQVLYYAHVEEPLIALTLDDGPDPNTTPRILEILAENEATATCFVFSDEVQAHPELTKQLLQGGHELGNHHTRDVGSFEMPLDEFEQDLQQAAQVLSHYDQITWFRPGKGVYTPKMLEVIHRHGYRCALGTLFPFDTHIASVTFAVWYFWLFASPGAVIILHDRGSRGKRTAQILRRTLPSLRKRGFRVVSLTRLCEAAEQNSH